MSNFQCFLLCIISFIIDTNRLQIRGKFDVTPLIDNLAKESVSSSNPTFRKPLFFSQILAPFSCILQYALKNAL